MMRWRIVRAKSDEITTKSEVQKTIFDVKFPTSKVVFLTFEVVFAFWGTKNRGDRQASQFVLQRYHRIEQNPNRIFRSYPQVRVVNPLFCNLSAPKMLVFAQRRKYIFVKIFHNSKDDDWCKYSQPITIRWGA